MMMVELQQMVDEPNTLGDFRNAFMSGLERIFGPKEKPLRKLFKLAQRRESCILKADLPHLQKHNVELCIDGQHRSLALIRLHRDPVKISISHFDAETVIKRNTIAIKLRPLNEPAPQHIHSSTVAWPGSGKS